jgi:hypothetical protein
MPARASVVKARPVPPVESPVSQVGRLVGFDARGRLLVEVPGTRSRLVARSVLRMDKALRRAVLQQRDVLLMFDGGDAKKPIVVGIVQPTPDEPAAVDGELAPAPSGMLALEADVDGERVKLSAREEIVLQCGEASITLRRNGRVIIKGVQVDSQASGTQRIRGGQVRLN